MIIKGADGLWRVEGSEDFHPSQNKYYNVILYCRRSSSCVACETIYYMDAQELQRAMRRADVIRIEEIGSYWMEHKEAGYGRHEKVLLAEGQA